MIIVMKMTATEKDVEKVSKMVTDKGLNVSVVNGTGQSVIGIIGDTTQIDPKAIEVDEAVDHVMRVSEPYKLANRAFHPDDTIVDVAGVKVGGDNLALIAGPCSVESEEQVIEIAKAAKAAGANILRGGAFKPRTSPYAFQGMGVRVIRGQGQPSFCVFIGGRCGTVCHQAGIAHPGVPVGIVLTLGANGLQ